MVRKKAFWRNNIRTIKKSINRFLAMLSIVFLSTAIITGLLVTGPNMKKSMTESYLNQNTLDINLMMPTVKQLDILAFTNDNIDFIKSKNHFKDVEGFNLKEREVLTKTNNGKLNGLIYEYDFSNKINSFELIQTMAGLDYSNLEEDQVIVEQSSYYLKTNKIGDYINIEDKEYQIVGISNNQHYFSKEAEKSLIDNKTYEIIVYKNIKDSNYYSNIYLTINKEGINDLFTKKYDNLLKDNVNYLETEITGEILEDRKNEIINKYPFLNKDDLKFDIYIIDKNSNISYQTFKNLINKVDQITKLFPIFFLLISALVVLTTMTRMIEEERQQVGVLRSIGYSKASIYGKYIFYGLLVAVLGVLIGYATGFRLIPVIINNAFKTVFHLPNLNLDIYSTQNMIYLLIIVLIIVITTIFSVKKTLNQTTSELLLPKSPKYGKRILLEKMPRFWNRLKFKYKSSLRNLFRYPKHFLMTVIGVMGSLALVFTGISLTSAVDGIAVTQYDKIFKYNYELSVGEYQDDMFDYFKDNQYEYLKIKEFGDIFTTKKSKETFYVTVKIVDGDNINDFIRLKNRTKKPILNLNNDGVIITEQIATYLNLKVGDNITIDQGDEFLITGITENYIENFIYIKKELYDSSNLEKDLLNKVLLNTDDDLKLDELSNFEVNSIISIETQANEKNRQLNQVKLLAIVIVLAAVFLQVIIIYNLTNVNISERDKELSTLKVLGYTNYEVSSYIFREVNIMTTIGMILGIPLGILIQRYVIFSVDSPNMMLGRDLGWYSFASSIPLTILMTMFVEFIMYFKIKNIDMVSALKEL